jgi:uncharacterized coiled-coil DUF342 family protein
MKTNLKKMEWAQLSELFPEGVYMPNANNTLQKIDSQSSLDNYKNEIINKFGEVDILVNKDGEIYNKIKIISDEFDKVSNALMDSKRKSYNY